MPKLIVKDFSCISFAELELSRMTVVIGPQGSGKSVLTKLQYFFQYVISESYDSGDTIVSSVALREFINHHFRKWFPESAWGNGRFFISYQVGPISISLHRDRPYKVQRTTFQIELSKAFDSVLTELQAAYRDLITSEEAHGVHISRRVDFRLTYQLARQYNAFMRSVLKEDFIDEQMFIPAGRSFFTSIGKAIAVFEHSNSLDPLTLMFGRMWGHIKDSRYEIIGDPDVNRERMHSIFGGTIQVEKDQEFIVTDDGRKVPFSSLSSGQQELLPLWLGAEAFFSYAAREHVNSLLYIEEPEAHLFPSAQSSIVEFLACKLVSDRARRSMVITTHSPYVLTKLNNLILAGKIASSSRAGFARVRQVVDRSAWIPKGWVRAYAIEDGIVSEITDDDGLIDGSYLDRISGDIADEFDKLIEIEATL